ncbi:unnamed protein product [Parnassius mnemosyne]|uniref:Tyr recombinase domain-containing protein n=1 Tax=Parnassius mnemosyne TaxID=213953 RepID=A0AAV1LXT4_9NEOP
MCLEQFRRAGTNMQTIKRLIHPIQTQATSNTSKSNCDSELQDQNFLKYDSPNSKYVKVRSTRTGGAECQLPFHILFGAKTRRQLPSNIEFETTEQVRQNETLQTVQSLSSTHLSAASGLDGKIRPKPSLLSRSDCSASSKIFEAELSHQFKPAPTASDDLFTVWPFLCAENVCLNNKLGSRVSQESGHQMCSLFGRFSIGKSVDATTTRRYIFNDKDHAVTGLDNKFRKVRADSDTVPRVSRHNMGHKTQCNVLIGEKVLNATQRTSATALKTQVVPQTVSDLNGETQFCHLRNPERSASLSNTAILQSTVVKGPPLPPSEYSTTSSIGDGMVATSCRSICTDTHECSTNSPSNNRCFRHRLGRATRRYKYRRDLDETATNLARKQKRNVRSSCSDITRTKTATELTSASSDGQSNSGVLHKQGRRKQVQKASRANSTTTCTSRQIQYTPSGPVLSRQIQCRSGRPITPKDLPRVAPNNSGDIQNISNVGHAGDRPICVEYCSRDPEVCFSEHSGQASTTPQRVLSPVALQTSMVIPTTQSYSQSPKPFESSQRTIYINCPEMEQGVLASRCSTPSSAPPLSNSRSSPHSSRHENRHTPSTDSRLALGGMVDFGWQDMLTEWTDKEQKLLISSWRGSTINTYKPAWNRWKKWCESNSVNYKYPHPEQVARYLAHLHCDIGLAYRTILVHKSVISTFTHLTSKVDLSSNFFIKHMLKAISMARTRPVKPPIWNPKFLMQYISKYNPNENNLYEVSRHTATLLLLASSRRVHDLTLLHIDNNSLIDDQSSIILWPAFGSKTDSINHRQSGWRLKEHPDKNLNIIFWIRQLLKISKNRRKAINHLFITARGDAKPASRTVIAGWVKSLLREAGIEATPGSVRSAVSSLNWLENFSLDKILETGNWKTVHTFQNYYKKELKEIDINNSVSLSNYFDAIN